MYIETNWLRDLKMNLLARLRYWLFTTDEEFSNHYIQLATNSNVMRKKRSEDVNKRIIKLYSDPNSVWEMNIDEYCAEFGDVESSSNQCQSSPSDASATMTDSRKDEWEIFDYAESEGDIFSEQMVH